jgi:hypothetical protein
MMGDVHTLNTYRASKQFLYFQKKKKSPVSFFSNTFLKILLHTCCVMPLMHTASKWMLEQFVFKMANGFLQMTDGFCFCCTHAGEQEAYSCAVANNNNILRDAEALTARWPFHTTCIATATGNSTMLQSSCKQATAHLLRHVQLNQPGHLRSEI